MGIAARLALVLSAAGLGLPAVASAGALEDRIAHEAAAGRMGADEALVWTVVGAVRPELLPGPLLEVARADAGMRGCATSLLVELRRRWERLPPELREIAARALGWEPAAAATRSAAAAWSSCRSEVPNAFESDHFRILWGSDTSLVNEAGVEALAESLESSRSTFLDLGYLEPAGIGTESQGEAWKLPIYMGNTGSEVPTIGWSGGYTTGCPDNWQAAYIVLSPDMEDFGMQGWEVAAHELYHAVQFAYNNYGVAGWWWEASATWAEDVAWPDSNGFAWFTDYQRAPWVTIEMENGSHEYSMYVLATSLEEVEKDGVHLMREIWETPASGVPAAFDSLLESRGTTFSEAFARFTGHAAHMAFEDHDVISLPTTSGSASEYPAELEPGQDPPDRWGTHYFKLTPPGDAGQDLTKVVADLDGLGDPKFVLALTRVREDGTALVTTAAAGDDGTATLEGIDFGTLYNPAYVAVSYTDGQGDGSYSLRVEVVAQTEEPGSDEPPPPDGDDDVGDPPAEDVGAGCGGASPFAWGDGGSPNGGCDAAPSPPLAGGLAALLALASSRRRRA